MGLADMLRKGRGEGLRLGGLRTGGAVGVQRVADDDNLDLVLADEPRDGLEVGAQVRASAWRGGA